MFRTDKMIRRNRFHQQTTILRDGSPVSPEVLVGVWHLILGTRLLTNATHHRTGSWDGPLFTHVEAIKRSRTAAVSACEVGWKPKLLDATPQNWFLAA